MYIAEIGSKSKIFKANFSAVAEESLIKLIGLFKIYVNNPQNFLVGSLRYNIVVKNF